MTSRILVAVLVLASFAVPTFAKGGNHIAMNGSHHMIKAHKARKIKKVRKVKKHIGWF